MGLKNVIVMIMLNMGQHKVVSNQILYPSMEMCEVDRILLVGSLEETKPNKTAQTFSKCVGLELDKPKVSL